MKKLILIGFLAISTIANAQTLINKKDDFTGKYMKAAVVVFGRTMAPQPISLMFGINEGKKYIAFSWSAKSGIFGAFNNMSPSQLSLLFKTDTVNIIRFKADTTISKILNNGNSTLLVIASPITDDQLMNFAKNRILRFRFGTMGDQGVDMDGPYMFTDKNKIQVQKAAAYMLDMQIIADDQ